MLVQLWALSSLIAVSAAPLQAHEVSPTVADLTVVDGRVDLSLRITLESFLAGIDLDTAQDTNDVPQADDYDALRALSAAELNDKFTQFAPDFMEQVQISGPDSTIVLSVKETDIPPVGDVELPRLSQVTLSGDLPAGTEALQVSWPEGYGTLILRQIGPDNPYTGYISGGQSSPQIPLAGGAERGFLSVLGEYIPVGFDHIIPKGLDHILFVLGLFFFSTALRPLLIQVTSFTLAHTVTLALGALGIVNIPGSIVEPIIAASIVYVAIENVFARGLNPWRPAIIFVFGLLHGLGFASVLGDFGLPSDQFIAALIGFNVGVEVGQLTVIALAFIAVGYWFGGKTWYRSMIAIPASLAIAAVGAYWFIERVFL